MCNVLLELSAHGIDLTSRLYRVSVSNMYRNGIWDWNSQSRATGLVGQVSEVQLQAPLASPTLRLLRPYTAERAMDTIH